MLHTKSALLDGGGAGEVGVSPRYLVGWTSQDAFTATNLGRTVATGAGGTGQYDQSSQPLPIVNGQIAISGTPGDVVVLFLDDRGA